MKRLLSFVCLFLFAISAYGQANGKLQIHYMDVGQGDGAVLISPQGEILLFDNGFTQCEQRSVKYLTSLGITHIDYMIISHYHKDHFGCTKAVLDKFPLTKASYDRPGDPESVTDAYNAYVAAVGSKRKHVNNDTVITLDADSSNPVTINIAAFGGAGVETTNENDQSVVAVVHFGEFDVMMAGDLSGFNTTRYKDIETPVSKIVGQVEVLKINHHGSDHSSNSRWLAKLKPRVAMISAGNGNTFGHPTPTTVQRLHDTGIVKVYWTERGTGATPKPGRDVVANGAIKVQVSPGAGQFTVSYKTKTHTYSMWPTPYNGER
jgi:competence protein ComEC